jgi:hypothetical protein
LKRPSSTENQTFTGENGLAAGPTAPSASLEQSLRYHTFFLLKKGPKKARKRKKNQHLIQELKTPCWVHQWLFSIVIRAPGRVYKRFLCANNNNEGGKKKGRWIKTIAYSTLYYGCRKQILSHTQNVKRLYNIIILPINNFQ